MLSGLYDYPPKGRFRTERALIRVPHFKDRAMAWLILGLVIFLGVHSVRIVAEGWRSQVLSNWGEAKWTGICSLLSVVGFGLIVLGSVTRRVSRWCFGCPT